MPYVSTHDATVAETSVNRIIIANAYADLYVAGQEISIGTSEGNNSIAADRTVTSIDVYDASNKAISFDGAAVNIAIGNNVWSSRQKNGKCDSIGQGTGRAAGTTGKPQSSTEALKISGATSGNGWTTLTSETTKDTRISRAALPATTTPTLAQSTQHCLLSFQRQITTWSRR